MKTLENASGTGGLWWLRWLFLPVISGLLVLRAGAAPVPVNNGSFESATYTGTQSWTYDLTDADPETDIEWDGMWGNNQTDQAFIERIGGFAADGQAHLGLNTGYFVFQDTQVAWLPNRRYVLTVAAGRRNATYSTSGNLSVFGLTNELPVAESTGELLGFDPLLAEAHAEVPAFEEVEANSRFADFSMTFETGVTAPTGTIVVFLGDNSASGRSHFDHVRLEVFGLDQDGDGLPSDWEVENGLNPDSASGNDGAQGDPDNDLSSNLEEFQRGTKANNPDTDGDGALDGWETKSGVYVSSTNTGTDPLVADTDGDTIADGGEISGAIVTDPNKRDTDGDGFEDQVEIAAGTNPSAGGAASFPTSDADVIAGVNFVGGRVDGTPGAPVTGTAGAVAQSNWVNAEDLGGRGLAMVDSEGAPVMMRVDWTVDDTFTVGIDPPADANDALMTGYLKTRKEVETTVTIRNIPYPNYDVYVYADAAESGLTADYTVNGHTISGVMDDEDWPVGLGGGTFRLVTGNNTAGNYMIFRGVTGSVMNLTVTNTTDGNDFGGPVNAIQIVRSSTDTDGDGMPDSWEVLFGLNPAADDAAADPDGDGLSNLGEFQAGTLPNNPDTDGDGLQDGVETGTGTWVSGDNRGTNPLNPDTDGDGLADGVESNSGTYVSAANTGSNPHLADTDGDGFTDGLEVTYGSNPVLASSVPQLPAPIGYWSFDDRGADTTADLSPGGNDGFLEGEPLYVAGYSGTAGDYALEFDGIDDAVVTAPILDLLEQYTATGWVYFTDPQPARTGLFGANDTVEFGMIDEDTLEFWTPTGGAIQAAFGPDTGGWRHLAITDDGTQKRLFIDGQLAVSGAIGVPLAGVGSNFNIGGAGVQDAAGNYFLGRIDDVAVWDVALDPELIARLAAGGSPLGGDPVPPAAGVEITLIEFDADARSVTLTFRSVAGKSYSVVRSDNLGAWSSAGATVTATGATTRFTDAAIPAGEVRRFYRVSEAP